MQLKSLATGILTAGLVLVVGYFGLDKFLHPILWIGWIPTAFDGLLGLSINRWLMVIGSFEITLALMLVMPWSRVRKAGALLIAMHLIAVLTQVGWNVTGARDMSILLSSVSLFLLL